MFCLRRANRTHFIPCQRRTLVTNLDEGRKLSIKDLVFSTDAQKFEKGKFEVNGYVQSIRKQKKVVFVAVRDGSCLQTLQAVLQPEHGRKLVFFCHLFWYGSADVCAVYPSEKR